jgi:hypothetical protein
MFFLRLAETDPNRPVFLERLFNSPAQALVDLVKRSYGYRFAPGEVVVSPNGVDLARYQETPSPSEARCALGLPETLTMGYTGHLYPGRGMGLLVELAHRFPGVFPVGMPPWDVTAWKKRLEEAKIDNVTLISSPTAGCPLPAAADIPLPHER